LVRFIHTADWQIGKPYRRVKDEQKRFKLRQERLNAISRIREAAQMNGSKFVLIAGDLFDSPTPSSSSVTEVLEIIGEINVPVIVIPGNHDHGALGTVWHTDNFKKYQKQMAPNLSLLLESDPFEIEDAIILPCPLVRNKDNTDPTLWLRNFNWNTISISKPRIVLAHGSVREFGGQNYNLDEETPSRANNLVNLDQLPIDEIDYIALGDWHNLKQVSENAWYSGTPEPDRFDQGENNNRGQVLQVDVSRLLKPEVKSIATGRIKWHNLNFRFNSDKDLDRFERQVEDLTAGRVSRDLLRVEISGALSLSGYSRFELLKADLENKLIRLRIKGECHKVPESDELEELTSSIQDPLIAQVAGKLKERLNREEDLDSEQASIIRLALCELYRLTEISK
tara:strand:+ start:470 stop:1657 length:1188 start_codon:yes stop_codon:yes gene_type:complete